jgi:hypothetical protein
MEVTTAFDSRSRTEKDQTKIGVEYVVPVRPSCGARPAPAAVRSALDVPEPLPRR